MTPRSWLFTPADDPAKMAKACAAGADAVILDLEDAVAPARKVVAREEAVRFLAERAGTAGPALWVRINPLASGLADQDLAALAGVAVAGVVLPKARGPADAAEVERRLAVAVLPLVTETPEAVFALGGYASAGLSRLAGMSWGAEDLSAAVGAVSPRDAAGRLTEPYRLARSLTLMAAAAAGVAAVETVYPHYADLEGLAAYAAEARRDGFQGMLAIHPAQVAAINAAFTPTAAEVDHARAVTAAFAATPDAGTVGLDGRMLDRPHLVQAQRLLERFSALGL